MTNYPQFDLALRQGNDLMALLSGLQADAKNAEAALSEIKTHLLAQDKKLRQSIALTKKDLEVFVLQQEESLNHNVKVIDTILTHLTGSRVNETKGR